jgi:peptidoglycan/LPS O-acetylase OafA/YrhL
MAFWTLEIEIIFSLIFPFLVIIINRFGLKKTALFIFSSSLSIRVFGSYTSFIFDYANPIKDCIFARLDDFLLGMIICYIYFKKSNILKKIEDKKVLKILIPICIITACLIVDLKQNKQLEYIFLMAFINNLLQIAFGLLIISCLIRKDKFIVMFFENYFLRLIGVMCYSLYSWNMLIIGKINWGIMYDIPDFFLTLMIIFLLSAFTFRFIEFREENNLKKLFLINTDG